MPHSTDVKENRTTIHGVPITEIVSEIADAIDTGDAITLRKLTHRTGLIIERRRGHFIDILEPIADPRQPQAPRG